MTNLIKGPIFKTSWKQNNKNDVQFKSKHQECQWITRMHIPTHCIGFHCICHWPYCHCKDFNSSKKLRSLRLNKGGAHAVLQTLHIINACKNKNSSTMYHKTSTPERRWPMNSTWSPPIGAATAPHGRTGTFSCSDIVFARPAALPPLHAWQTRNRLVQHSPVACALCRRHKARHNKKRNVRIGHYLEHIALFTTQHHCVDSIDKIMPFKKHLRN